MSVCHPALALVMPGGKFQATSVLCNTGSSSWHSSELHAAPLDDPRPGNADALTLDQVRPDERGSIELPIGGYDHLYMLRAADHRHPLVNGQYGFVPPYKLNCKADGGPISDQVLDLIEGIPVSYLTVHQSLVAADDNYRYSFLDRAVSRGRLR